MSQLVLTNQSPVDQSAELNQLAGARLVKAKQVTELDVWLPFQLKDLDAVLQGPEENYVLARDEDELLLNLNRRFPSAMPGGSRTFNCEYQHTVPEESTHYYRRHRRTNTRHYSDCYLILPRPLFESFVTIEELAGLTERYGTLFVDVDVVFRVLRDHTPGFERKSAIGADRQCAVLEWLRTHGFIARHVERYGLLKVRYDPKQVARLDYTEKLRAYKARFHEEFDAKLYLGLVAYLGNFARLGYDRVMESVEVYVTGGWGSVKAKSYDVNDVMELLEIHRKLFPKGCKFRDAYIYSKGVVPDYSDVVERALPRVHGILVQYRKAAARHKADPQNTYPPGRDLAANAWLARWLLREARKLDLDIPAPPREPKPPRSMKKKGGKRDAISTSSDC